MKGKEEVAKSRVAFCARTPITKRLRRVLLSLNARERVLLQESPRAQPATLTGA